MSVTSSIFFMLGRFQPFTLGHLALVNEMLIKTAETPDSIAYLFVSHKMLKPSHYKKVAKLHEVLAESKDPSDIKRVMKTKDSIMDYPLNATDRVRLVLALFRKIYPEVEISPGIRGEYVIRVSSIFNLESRRGNIPLERSVELHIINSSKVENTSGYKAHSWLKRKYNNIKASMVTGSNRVLDFQPLIMANNPVRINRNEDDSTSSNHFSKLSGSKIRTWCILYHVTRDEKWLNSIVDSYYKLLSPEDVLRLIVEPIIKGIFGAQASPKSSASAISTARTKRRASSPPPKSSASATGPTGPARTQSPPKSSASATSTARTKRRASSPPKSGTSVTNSVRSRASSPPKSASVTNSVRSRESSPPKSSASVTGPTGPARTKRRTSQVNSSTSVGTRRSKRLTRRG
jgi:hypothetical protein